MVNVAQLTTGRRQAMWIGGGAGGAVLFMGLVIAMTRVRRDSAVDRGADNG